MPIVSGALYGAVPQRVVKKVPSACFDTPKSVILTKIGLRHATRIFFGLE